MFVDPALMESWLLNSRSLVGSPREGVRPGRGVLLVVPGVPMPHRVGISYTGSHGSAPIPVKSFHLPKTFS